jgi:hypothetical protein
MERGSSGGGESTAANVSLLFRLDEGRDGVLFEETGDRGTSTGGEWIEEGDVGVVTAVDDCCCDRAVVVVFDKAVSASSRFDLLSSEEEEFIFRTHISERPLLCSCCCFGAIDWNDLAARDGSLSLTGFPPFSKVS